MWGLRAGGGTRRQRAGGAFSTWLPRAASEPLDGYRAVSRVSPSSATVGMKINVARMTPAFVTPRGLDRLSEQARPRSDLLEVAVAAVREMLMVLDRKAHLHGGVSVASLG
jgi:hypothetical protein